VWLGNRHQGLKGKIVSRRNICEAGCNGIAGLSPEVVGPRGRYLTGLVEPCGALPRKCSFTYPGPTPRPSNRD
jgi:hypothetical protein